MNFRPARVTLFLPVLTVLGLAGVLLLFPARASSEDLSTSSQTSFRVDIHAPVVRSLKELSFDFYPEFKMNGGLRVRSAEWNIRDDTFRPRFPRVPAYGNFSRDGIRDERPGHTDIGEESLDRNELIQIGALSPGTYYLALLINGGRASNVVQFQIDPGFDLSKAPIFTLCLQEAAPGRRFSHLMLWAVGPTPNDPNLTNYRLAYVDLYVDEKLYAVPPDSLPWSGPVVPLKSGDSWCIDQDLTLYPYQSIDLTKANDFRIQLDRYKSNTLHTDLSKHPWADQWDANTPGPSTISH